MPSPRHAGSVSLATAAGCVGELLARLLGEHAEPVGPCSRCALAARAMALLDRAAGGDADASRALVALLPEIRRCVESWLTTTIVTPGVAATMVARSEEA